MNVLIKESKEIYLFLQKLILTFDYLSKLHHIKNKLSFYFKNYIKFKLVVNVFDLFVLIQPLFREAPMRKYCNPQLYFQTVRNETPVL